MEPQAIQQSLTATPEETTFLGREAVRVSATAVQEQVLHNNVGAMYLPASEIESSVDAWNFTPVTLGHPKSRGQPISGREPNALNDYGVGVFANCTVEDGALKGDVYLWRDRLEEIEGGEAVLEAVNKQNPVEVSTGFSGDFYHEEAEFQGDSYEVVAQNIGPDHFAVLPGGEGACSVEDGCGLGVNQREQARSRESLAGSGGVAEGEVPESWPPTEEAYEEAGVTERAEQAAHTLLGPADADTFAESQVFPVVNPETGEIEEGALRAILSGRGAQADVAENALENARNTARSILEDEGLMESGGDAENLLRRVLNRLEELVRPAENQDGMSLDDLREAVREHLDERFGAQDRFVFIEELFEDEVIYAIEERGGEDRLFRAPYEVSEDGEVSLGERTQVTKQVEFVPATNGIEAQVDYRAALAANEEKEMDTQQLIEALADNEDVPYDAEALEAMGENQLAFVANAAGVEIEDEEADEAEEAGEEPAANADDTEPPAWAEEILNRLDRVEEATEPVREEQAQKRRRLASEVAQNSAFTEEELEDKPIAELEKLRKAVRPRDFSGLGGPSRSTVGEEDIQFVENSTMGEDTPGS